MFAIDKVFEKYLCLKAGEKPFINLEILNTFIKDMMLDS